MLCLLDEGVVCVVELPTTAPTVQSTMGYPVNEGTSGVGTRGQPRSDEGTSFCLRPD